MGKDETTKKYNVTVSCLPEDIGVHHKNISKQLKESGLSEMVDTSPVFFRGNEDSGATGTKTDRRGYIQVKNPNGDCVWGRGIYSQNQGNYLHEMISVLQKETRRIYT